MYGRYIQLVAEFPDARYEFYHVFVFFHLANTYSI